VEDIEIRIRGQIDRDWSDWLQGMSIAHVPGGETVLTGHVRDQAALRGLLSRLADLNLALISLQSQKTNGRVAQQPEVSTM
jgi:hypothetical protein